MFGIKVKKARGTDLINQVADRFGAMIEELDQEVADCRSEQSGIKDTISQLRERESVLELSVKRAAAITTNLRTLLGA